MIWIYGIAASFFFGLQCNAWRLTLGARGQRLALWCSACTTEAERQSGLCRACMDKYGRIVCHHCESSIDAVSDRHKCPEEAYGRVFNLCKTCKPVRLAGARVQCKTCW